MAVLYTKEVLLSPFSEMVAYYIVAVRLLIWCMTHPIFERIRSSAQVPTVIVNETSARK
jgi:hypothetical protein